MSKWEKLIQRILSLSKDLRFDELRKVLESCGYQMFELVTKTRTNEKVVRESGGEQLLKGYRGEIAQRLMNPASVVEQQVFRNRI